MDSETMMAVILIVRDLLLVGGCVCLLWLAVGRPDVWLRFLENDARRMRGLGMPDRYVNRLQRFGAGAGFRILVGACGLVGLGALILDLLPLIQS